MPTKISSLAVGNVFGRRLATVIVSTRIVMLTIQAAMNVGLAVMTRFAEAYTALKLKFTVTGMAKIGRVFRKQTLPLSSSYQSIAWQKKSLPSRRQF